MTRPLLAACVLGLTAASSVFAQTAGLDVTQSAGASSEAISAAGVQARALAEPVHNLRLAVEGAWGDRRGPASDVFGTAYPYGGRLDVVEAYAEWVRRGTGLRAVRAGRYRTPFGISSASDHAYLGFLRPPLIRYGSSSRCRRGISSTASTCWRAPARSRSKAASGVLATSVTRFAGRAPRAPVGPR
ncbi:MAG: hypothetical protein U0P30_04245 [Vicinamibacterales bacterium]